MNVANDLVHGDDCANTWVTETARRPIAFAQVREDALLDQWVVDRLPSGAHILMVASGGCTAAMLASMQKLARLHLVDPNPAQIALSRLKLRLLMTACPMERLSLLGHVPMSVPERRLLLTTELRELNLPIDALGSIELVAAEGPDHVGRYEILFAKLRHALSEVADELRALLELRDIGEQSGRVAHGTPLGKALDAAFDTVMALPNLVGLFGEAATRNRFEPFSRHFARRTRHVLSTLPAAENPYLWQMLLGQFPKPIVYPWLNAAAPSRMPEVFWTVSTMADALQHGSQQFDFIHLSNILDWLELEEARSMLALVWNALRPGGCTFIRQLNSALDIPGSGECFDWETKSAEALHNRDRSFFYRGVYLGRKK